MDVGRICAELVRIPSENPPDRTAEIIEYIRDLFETMGIASTVTGNSRGECNIVTTGTGKDLLLCGHVDVVPAEGEGWEFPPCSGEERDGFVWGRGATDMKGGCASIIHACESMVENDIPLPATIAFVCDEESGGENGIRTLLSDKLILPCDCVVAEPTPARNPCIGQKGLCRLELLFSGTPAHGSLYPAVGESAIMNAVSLLGQMKFLHERTYPVDSNLKEILEQSSRGLEQEFGIAGVSDILKKITYNPGIINGGEKSNVVAQQCRLELDPDPLRVFDPGSDQLCLPASPRSTIISQETHEPSMTDRSSRIVATTCREVQAVYGGEVFPIIQWAASDARHLRKAGFNVIEYGPGEIRTLHAVNERVSLDSLKKASCIYQGIMQSYR